MMVRGLIERDSGAGSFVPTDHGRAALEALLSRPLAVSVAGKSGREGGHGNIDASDPNRTLKDEANSSGNPPARSVIHVTPRRGAMW
jgi:hypothetical protein